MLLSATTKAATHKWNDNNKKKKNSRNRGYALSRQKNGSCSKVDDEN